MLCAGRASPENYVMVHKVMTCCIVSHLVVHTQAAIDPRAHAKDVRTVPILKDSCFLRCDPSNCVKLGELFAKSEALFGDRIRTVLLGISKSIMK